MKWLPFHYGKDTFDLSHLHPQTIKYVQDAKGDKPECVYTVELSFSMHCFTRKCKPGESPDPSLYHRDDRETRVFDLDRYRLSYRLPEIAEGLMKRKCYHTGHGNFFTVEMTDQQTGKRRRYEIYFVASRSPRKGIINLKVQSAYVRDEAHPNLPQHKPIGFYVILFNVLNNKTIRIPK